jgi:hypothetical protein
VKTIVYSIPLGYFARTLLRTGVPQILLRDKDVRIVILSPAYNNPEFVSEFSFNHRVYFEELLPLSRKYVGRDDIKPSRIGGRDPNLAEKILWKICILTWERVKNKKIFLFLMHLNHILYTLFSKRLYDGFFNKYKPDLIITATPGLNSQRDIPLIREAKNRGIKTLCLVYSWDNLSGGKGIIPVRPDYLGVWNELQRKEAIELHYYEPSKVIIVGATQFDIYQDKGIYCSREEFFKKMRLDPAKKLVTIVTASMIRAENSFILDILVDMLRKQRFTTPVQLLCRLHPQDKIKNYSNFLDSNYIVIDCPGKKLKGIGWNPDRTEMIHLANTLKHSDVVVNIASTVTIEASILDIPVVNLGFSSSEPERFKREVMERAWKYHYRYIKERNATFIAGNENDLVDKINRYLIDPSIHRAERNVLAQDLCYKLDGKSYERVANLIFDLLKTNSDELAISRG